MKRALLIVIWIGCSVRVYLDVRQSEHGRWTNMHRMVALLSATTGPLGLAVEHLDEWFVKEASW